MKRVRKHLSFANVTAMLALFVALGGTSYAALARNSVGHQQIRKNAVRSSEVRKNAVGSSEVRNNKLRKSDIGANAVGRSELADDGVTGTEVEDGSLGPADLTAGAFMGPTIRAYQSNAQPVPDGSSRQAQVTCQEEGEALVSGAVHLAGPSATGANHDDAHVTVSRPERQDAGVPANGSVFGVEGDNGFVRWRGVVRNPAGGDGATEMRVWVLCAGAPPAG
jgi:hypothetical protein